MGSDRTHPCTFPTMLLRFKCLTPLYNPTSSAWLLSPFVNSHCSSDPGLTSPTSRQLAFRGSEGEEPTRYESQSHDALSGWELPGPDTL